MLKQFTINRATWARGVRETGDSNLLLDCDGGRCCLGFYLRACGVPDDALRAQGDPSDVADIDEVEDAQWLVGIKRRMRTRDNAQWLVGIKRRMRTRDNAWVLGIDNSVEAIKLMEANDGPQSEVDREKEVADLFAKQGIKVEFKG